MSSFSPFRPWTFHGHGLLSFFPARRDLVPPGRRPNFRGGVSAALLLNYTASPVGPYQELLYVGGFFGEAGLVRPSVTRILVNSAASEQAGRALWGLPKELAVFDWQDRFVRVSQNERLLAELSWTASGPPLPVTGRFVPRCLRTLAQPWKERTLLTSPGLSVHARPARLGQLLINPGLFPDFRAVRPRLSFELSRFTWTFPAPQVR